MSGWALVFLWPVNGFEDGCAEDMYWPEQGLWKIDSGKHKEELSCSKSSQVSLLVVHMRLEEPWVGIWETGVEL